MTNEEQDHTCEPKNGPTIGGHAEEAQHEAGIMLRETNVPRGQVHRREAVRVSLSEVRSLPHPQATQSYKPGLLNLPAKHSWKLENFNEELPDFERQEYIDHAQEARETSKTEFENSTEPWKLRIFFSPLRKYLLKTFPFVSVRHHGHVTRLKVEIKFHLECKLRFSSWAIQVVTNSLNQRINKYRGYGLLSLLRSQSGDPTRPNVSRRRRLCFSGPSLDVNAALNSWSWNWSLFSTNTARTLCLWLQERSVEVCVTSTFMKFTIV